MYRQLAAGIVACGIFQGALHAAEPPPIEQLETFVVSGEQPGPGLWKVSKGDHVMWVLATYGPLPKDMTWRTRQVEERIAESQEVLYGGNVNVAANIGLLRGLTLIPAALKAGKIPDGRTLKDVLSAETYAKWLALRLKYIGKDDDVERWRPSIALEQLRGAAVKKNGLSGGPNVFAVVGDLRKKHKVASNALPNISRTVNVENPRGMLKSASKLDMPDLDCFIRKLDTLESDVERSRDLANAWAQGNVGQLRQLIHVRSREESREELLQDSCAFVLMTALEAGGSTDASRAKRTLDNVLWHAEQASVQSQIDWVAAAQKSLQKNPSTFALLSVADVLRSDGPLEKLRALGYSVEAPE